MGGDSGMGTEEKGSGNWHKGGRNSEKSSNCEMVKSRRNVDIFHNIYSIIKVEILRMRRERWEQWV